MYRFFGFTAARGFHDNFFKNQGNEQKKIEGTKETIFSEILKLRIIDCSCFVISNNR